MVCVSLATPVTEACDAVGGAFRPQWREWPARAIRRVLSERVAFGMLPAALFALLPRGKQIVKLEPGYAYGQSISLSFRTFYLCFL